VVWCVSVLMPRCWSRACTCHRHYSLLLALAFDVGLLYLTLGFRQFSHYFTDIRDALDRGDEDLARRKLAEWRHLDASELPRTEVLRHVIEHALLAAHRHVFGVFFWFVVLSALGLGPMGAVLYRMAEFASRYWGYRHRALDVPANEAPAGGVAQLFQLDRPRAGALTAFGFAVVGNFEEAIGSWRRDAALWQHPNEGIILAAAAGAVGVQLGGAAAPGCHARPLQDLQTAGAEADAATPRARPPACRRSPATCRAWSAWSGGRWCCGCCWWRCCRWPTCGSAPSATHQRSRDSSSNSSW
jgi:adenosylcobinamide-phosphate synthase